MHIKVSKLKEHSYLDAVSDCSVRSINLQWEIKPWIPAADLVRVIENVPEPVVDHITQLNINVLGPKLSKTGPKVKF